MPYGENASTNTNIATGRTDEYMQSDAFVYDLWCVKEQEVDQRQNRSSTDILCWK